MNTTTTKIRAIGWIRWICIRGTFYSNGFLSVLVSATSAFLHPAATVSKMEIVQKITGTGLIFDAIYSKISRFQYIRLKTRFCYANDICIKAGLFHDKAGLLNNNVGVMENTLGVLKIIHGVLEKPLRA